MGGILLPTGCQSGMDGQRDLGLSQLTSQQRPDPKIWTLQQRGIWNVWLAKNFIRNLSSLLWCQIWFLCGHIKQSQDCIGCAEQPRRQKGSSCRRQTAPGWFGRSYNYTSLYNNFRIGSDFLKHSIRTYWKGWIFLTISKEMILLWLCKSLLRKWPGLWGAVNGHKIDTQAVCLLHSKANTAATLAWIGLGYGTSFPPLAKRVCCADLMVSPRTSTLHTNLARSQREIDTGLSHFSGENFASSFIHELRLSLLSLLAPFLRVDVCCLQ